MVLINSVVEAKETKPRVPVTFGRSVCTPNAFESLSTLQQAF